MAKRDEVPNVLDEMREGGKAPAPPAPELAVPLADGPTSKPHLIQIRVDHDDYAKAKAMFARDQRSFSSGVRNLIARYVRGNL